MFKKEPLDIIFLKQYLNDCRVNYEDLHEYAFWGFFVDAPVREIIKVEVGRNV